MNDEGVECYSLLAWFRDDANLSMLKKKKEEKSCLHVELPV